MKCLPYFLFFSMLSSVVFAQDCESFSDAYTFNQNELKLILHDDNDAHDQVLLRTSIGSDGAVGEGDFATLLYSTNIWAGGVDSDRVVRVAAGTYGNTIATDWKVGPLTADGQVVEEDCEIWDATFTVSRDDVTEAIYNAYDQQTCELKADIDCDAIPEAIRNFPARGNSFFFDDPESSIALQSYGLFFDRSNNGIYEPCDGDFPYPTITGCENLSACSFSYIETLPTSFSYWITNDGGTHDLTGGLSLQLEVHHYAMFFDTPVKQDIRWNYIVKNKGASALDSFHFSVWADYDIGCYFDDFAMTDPENNAMYFFNEDSVDGQGASHDCQGLNTFGNEPPIVRFKILRGLLESDSLNNYTSSNMSSAVFIPRTASVQQDNDYFNLMNGLRPNGDSFLDQNNEATTYLYTGNPFNSEEWSMCSSPSSTLEFDTRTVLSTRCESLQPGASNEVQTLLSYEASGGWSLPCPDSDIYTHMISEGNVVYNSCNYSRIGPSAPNLIASQTEGSIKLTYDNDFVSSNNKNLAYSEVDVFAPNSPGIDNTYNFEGYKIYQVKSGDFDLSLLEDSSVSKLVAQSDIQNGVSTIRNWYPSVNPADPLGLPVYSPNEKVNGADSGVEEFVTITKDRFDNNLPIVVGKSYYFVAIAYGYNEWDVWDPANFQGQKTPYLESTHNVKVTEVVFDQVNGIDPLHGEYEFTSTSRGFTLSNVNVDTEATLLNAQGQKVEFWNARAGNSLQVYFDDLNVRAGIYFVQLHSAARKSSRGFKILVVK